MRTKELHDMCYSAEYGILMGIIQRCCNPKNDWYPRYGGRGITVCDRWKNSFANFYQDMGDRPSPKHTVDRIDNDGPYSPENCRWATYQQQARNRKSTRWIEYNGERRPMAEWADLYGLRKNVLWHRLSVLKWPIEKALLHRLKGSEYGLSGC